MRSSFHGLLHQPTFRLRHPLFPVYPKLRPNPLCSLQHWVLVLQLPRKHLLRLPQKSSMFDSLKNFIAGTKCLLRHVLLQTYLALRYFPNQHTIIIKRRLPLLRQDIHFETIAAKISHTHTAFVPSKYLFLHIGQSL